jgi:hypothetical protein
MSYAQAYALIAAAPKPSTCNASGRPPFGLLAAICNAGRVWKMESPSATSTCYPVETSGWDLDENFFVEKTELQWSDEEKRINLLHPVRLGTVVFVRLLALSAQDTVCPVAYEVVRISYKPQLRHYEVFLTQLQPRTHASTLPETEYN